MDNDFAQCLKRQEELKEIFPDSLSSEERYFKIIAFGKNLPSFPESAKKEENRVTGCQSLTYLAGEIKEQKMHLYASSEALITRGLIALLVHVYDKTTPQTILKCPPHFLQSLGILASLSSTRAHGLKSFYEKLLKISIY